VFAPQTPGFPPTVLVVEDVPVIRDFAARVLAQEGLRVLTAANGMEAVAVLEREAVAVVLTDLKMPRMTGHELAAQVQARWPGVRMVFMTGHTEANSPQGLPGPLFMKPFDFDELASAVNDALYGAGQ
jgi:CheY-like chemotaxis protein